MIPHEEGASGAGSSTEDEIMSASREQGALGPESSTAGSKAVSARSLAGMLRSRIERAAEHKSETVSLGQFFADQIHRYLTEAGYGPEHDARAGDVPADDGDPDRDRGRDWGLRARQVHLEGLSRRAANGKWFASTNGADGLARIDNGTDAMFPVRCEWHEAEFIEALVNAYRRGDLTTPAPATPPGVPDSVREAVEAFDSDPSSHVKYFSAVAAAVNHVRTLLATHPAGQSAGSEAECGWRIVQIAPLTPALMTQEMAAAGKQANDAGCQIILAKTVQPAPDSSRTGDEGTEVPRVFKDGDAWCCLLGGNLQDGIAGFGDTPDEALKAFQRKLSGDLAPVLRGALKTADETLREAIREHTTLDWLLEQEEEGRGALAVIKAALAARPAAPEAQGAWSFDMEAAPREHGGELLGWGRLRGGAPIRAIMQWFDAEGDFNGETGWWTVAALPFEPIGWQRLPAPPTSSGQGGR